MGDMMGSMAGQSFGKVGQMSMGGGGGGGTMQRPTLSTRPAPRYNYAAQQQQQPMIGSQFKPVQLQSLIASILEQSARTRRRL